jgi:hypothetical protein
MRWTLARWIRKVLPLNTVQQRRNTEEIVGGMFKKYRGKSLDEEFKRVGAKEHEVDVLFDEIDSRYGEALASYNVKKIDAALNGAFTMIAGFVIEKAG